MKPTRLVPLITLDPLLKLDHTHLRSKKEGARARYRLALGAVHGHRGGGANRAQRHPCAFPVRLPVRTRFPRRRHARARTDAAASPAGLLAVDGAGRAGADRRHRADARCHERPLLRGGLRLYQDRAGAGRAVRPRVPRRRRDAGDGGRDHDRHRRCRRHGAQTRYGDGREGDAAGARRRRDVRALGGRLPRRDPESELAKLCHGRDLHRHGRAAHAIGAAVALSQAARSDRAARDPARLAAVAVRRLHGRAGVAVLVPRPRARRRRERAHAGFGRGAVRAGDLALRVQAGDHGARSHGHRPDRDRRRTLAMGALSYGCIERAVNGIKLARFVQISRHLRSTPMSKLSRRDLIAGGTALAGGALIRPRPVRAATKVRLLTNWFAEAEHGGFYQAAATWLYDKAGLDVEIRQGNAQLNGMQLLLGGEADIIMSYDITVLSALEKGAPIKAFFTSFQFDLIGLMTRPDVKSLADLKGRKVYFGANGYSSYWPWLKQRFGYTDDMAAPKGPNLATFFNDPTSAVAGYLTAEPYLAVQRNTPVKFFLFAEQGYPPYANTMATTAAYLKDNADAVTRFTRASVEGWREYLRDPTVANA